MRFTTFTLVVLAFPLAASAHHSTREYDRNTVLELEGTLTQVRWRNPHVSLAIGVENDQGGTDIWEMEGMDLASVTRQGVPSGTLQAGMIVRFAGHPSTEREHRMFVTNVLRTDGLEVLLRANTLPRWSENFVGGTFLEPDASLVQVDLEKPPEGIFRVWVTAERNAEAFNNPPLTDAARLAVADIERFTSPGCRNYGMPGAMVGARVLHPVEFVERGEDIVMRMEADDIERVFHMGSEDGAAEQPLTPLGYSTGRWDGDTLVVTTIRISEPISRIFPDGGIPQSEEVEIVERFTLDEAEGQLSYDISITDPVNLTRTVTASNHLIWRWRPGARVQLFDCEER